MMFGRVEVRVRGGDGYAFTGIGTLGWKRRFNASDVTSVTIGRTAWKKNDEAQPVIVIETYSGGKVRFGTILTNERRAWMTATLRELLVT